MVNILIIEDSKAFAKGLSMLISQFEEINQVFKAHTYEDAMDLLKSSKIDLVMLDLNFRVSRYDGFMIADKICEQYPKKSILILSDYVQNDFFDRLFKVKSVRAYIDKQSGEKELEEAIRTVILGDIYLCPFIQKMRKAGRGMDITKRQREIIDLLVKGYTQTKIAGGLFISENTVGSHVMNLLHKFEAKNTAELLVKYVEYKRSNEEDVEGSTPPFQKL